MSPQPSPDEQAPELNRQAMRAMAAGDFSGARALLQRALMLRPDGPLILLNLAACCRALGDYQAALTALEQVLRLNPRSFMALLMKGSLREREGQVGEAVTLYKAATALAPEESTLDAATQQALAHAQDLCAQHAADMSRFIAGEIRALGTATSGEEAWRINSFIELASGLKQRYAQEPTELYYPGLPAIEFYDRSEFPWIAALEAETASIRAELNAVLSADLEGFVPYVAYSGGLPLDQWQALNHSRRWSALHLHHYGVRVEENASRCPLTMAAIAQLPQPAMPGRSPAALFSALMPDTRIPPHTGVANTRLVTHLPLVVPGDCGFRVGNQIREWREGEAWVFDDTIEHEAWNLSSQVRVILICDVWNPRLSAAERELICATVAAMDKFSGGVKNSDI